ncbi:MAG: hypothetical protein EPO08_00775 [Rhodospirillaceae bacterium]|nr:MAG: hypothetical protein EPO08_00775 [Rhodospirillaceae bacterium]
MAVVLHIGLPKTGSSYLQEWLSLNREILWADGLHVVSADAAHRLGTEAAAGVADTQRRDVRQIQSSCAFSDAIGEIQVPGRKTIVASEYLSMGRPECLAEILASAKVVVSDVICYLRRQDHICASGYAQAVKALGHSERIGTALHTDRLDWHQLYETWRDAFPQATLHIYNYDKCHAEGRLLRSYKEALGAGGLATQDLAQYVNLSLSAEMTEIARMLNERGKLFDPDCLLKIQNGRRFVPFGFSKKTTAEFEELFIASNRKLAARFPQEFSDYAQPGWRSKGDDLTDQISPASMAEILMEYVHQRSAAA